jgi:DNA-binding NarL/FixJ family response regulator
MTRAVIADDQDLIRTGFRTILESAGVDVVGDAPNGREAVRVVRELRPEVVVMDVRMPVMDGIEATRLITEEGLAKVLVLTMFDLDQYVYEALRAGASGFLLKDAPKEELIQAVEVVARGDALLAPSVTRRLIDRFADMNPPSTRPVELSLLTERELDVLRTMARGLSNAEIATKLFVSEATVKSHVAHVLAKLGVRDRVQAVVVAYESGLATSGER